MNGIEFMSDCDRPSKLPERGGEIYPWGLVGVGWVLAVGPLVLFGWAEMFGLATPRVSFVQLLVLSMAGVLGWVVAVSGKRLYYSPFILVLFFLIGYPLRVVEIELFGAHWRSYSGGGAAGMFAFTGAEYWQLVALGTVGMIGVVTGILAARVAMRSFWPAGWSSGRVSGRRLMPLALVWFVVTGAVTGLNAHFSVGALTVVPVSLPGHLSGVLNVTRAYVLPLLGLWLFGVAICEGRRREAGTIVVMNVVLGVASVFTTLSKVAAFMPFVPYALCGVIGMRRFKSARAVRRLVVLAICVLAPISIVLANVLRSYSAGTGAIPSVSDLMSGQVRVGDVVEDRNGVSYVVSTVFDRMIGAGEAMAVIAGPRLSAGDLVSWIADPARWMEVYHQTIAEVWDFDPWAGRVVPQGRGFGLFGFWQLSGSLLVVFVASVIYSAMAVVIEGVMGRIGNSAVAAGVGFSMASLVWEFMPDVLRLYPFALVTVAAAILFLSRGVAWGRSHKHA